LAIMSREKASANAETVKVRLGDRPSSVRVYADQFRGQGFTTLIACRVLLGAGEGPAYPVALHFAYKWFPDELRTLPTAVISQGASIGVVLALPELNYLIVHYSWHWAFAALGLIGLLPALAWLAFGREGTLNETPTPVEGGSFAPIRYRRLLLNPTVLAACASGFGAYWGLSLMIAWLPHYLINGLGYTQQQTGLLSTLPWACNVFVVIGAGWLSQNLLAGVIQASSLAV
jgi:ACS family D-galactonate transporter-like MFS transporter